MAVASAHDGGEGNATHERLVAVHPFADGNGRTARLLMNMPLMRGGYPLVVIGPERRTEYNDSLQKLQVGSDRLAYRQFMTERLDASLDHHLFILRRGQEESADACFGPGDLMAAT